MQLLCILQSVWPNFSLTFPTGLFSLQSQVRLWDLTLVMNISKPVLQVGGNVVSGLLMHGYAQFPGA